MGADATFKIFVGIKIDSEERDNIFSKLPKEFLDEDGDLQWRIDLKEFSLEDIDEIGIGIEAFFNDWDDGIKSFNVEEVKNRIDRAREKVEKLFADCGISDKVDVFCFSDYS